MCALNKILTRSFGEYWTAREAVSERLPSAESIYTDVLKRTRLESKKPKRKNEKPAGHANVLRKYGRSVQLIDKVGEIKCV